MLCAVREAAFFLSVLCGCAVCVQWEFESVRQGFLIDMVMVNSNADCIVCEVGRILEMCSI